MIKTVDEFKELVIWARQNGVQKLKAKGIEIEISPVAAYLDAQSKLDQSTANQTQTPVDQKTPKKSLDLISDDPTEEDLLMWSVQK